jgi:uncharacterized protein
VLEKIERDLKAALLAGDKFKVEVLKGIKNAIQYETVSSGSRDSGLNDEQIQKVLVREANKRQEAAELYKNASEAERQKKEELEKEIIDSYLPEKVSVDDIKKAVDDEVSKLETPTVKDMGRIIGQVKAKLGAGADGAVIARLAKEALEQ